MWGLLCWLISPASRPQPRRRHGSGRRQSFLGGAFSAAQQSRQEAVCGERCLRSPFKDPAKASVAGPALGGCGDPAEGLLSKSVLEEKPAGSAEGSGVECGGEGLRGMERRHLAGRPAPGGRWRVGCSGTRARGGGGALSCFSREDFWVGGKSTKWGCPMSQVQIHS